MEQKFESICETQLLTEKFIMNSQNYLNQFISISKMTEFFVPYLLYFTNVNIILSVCICQVIVII